MSPGKPNLLIIGDDIEVFPPGVPMRPTPGGGWVPLYPEPTLWRGLRSDPYLVAGVASLAASLVIWAWLAWGGVPLLPAWGRAILLLPGMLAAASFMCLVVSIVPDWDLFWVDLQQR